MRYLLRTRWPMIVGLGGVLGIIAASVLQRADAIFDWSFMGLTAAVWGTAATVLVVALLVQLLVSSRAAFARERRLVRTAAQLREVSAELDRLARTDALTGIANRRSFFEMLGAEFRRSRRYARQLSVLMLDLDHFKVVNDQYGHPFGDHVLRRLAEVVSESIRESDLVGRYGGEEFAVALPEAGAEQAMRAAEKLRLAIEATEFRADGVPPDGEPPVRITISLGVASLSPDDDEDEFELIRRADQALYEAKRTGRNRSVLYSKALVAPPSEPSGNHTSESADPSMSTARPSGDASETTEGSPG